MCGSSRINVECSRIRLSRDAIRLLWNEKCGGTDDKDDESGGKTAYLVNLHRVACISNDVDM